MRLFEHSGGAIIAFGFDPLTRTKELRHVAWCDPDTKVWSTAPTNQAGYAKLNFDVNPEFVHECHGKIVAYQAGLCIEMTYVGGQSIWSIRTMQSDLPSATRAA